MRSSRLAGSVEKDAEDERRKSRTRVWSSRSSEVNANRTEPKSYRELWWSASVRRLQHVRRACASDSGLQSPRRIVNLTSVQHVRARLSTRRRRLLREWPLARGRLVERLRRRRRRRSAEGRGARRRAGDRLRRSRERRGC